jgi:hypothetical protein
MSESVTAIDTASVNIGSLSAKFALIGAASGVASDGLNSVVSEARGAYLTSNYIGSLTYDEGLRVMAGICVFCNLVLFGIKAGRWISEKFDKVHDKVHAASIRRKSKRR